MYNLLPRLAPVLALVMVFAGFLTVDRLWLHWYAPDTSNTPSEAVRRERTAAAKSVTPVPSTESRETQTTADPSPRASDAFAALWLAAQQTPYKVRYETSFKGDKGASYVIFNKPPLGRVDTIPSGGSQPFSQLFVDADGRAIRCTPLAEQLQCVSIEPFATPLPLAAGPIVFPPTAPFDSYGVTELDSQVFAGMPARCFHLASTKEGIDADYCFSLNDAPVPLYGRGTFGVVQASEVSSTVSDGDFVAPTPLPTPISTVQSVRFTSVVAGSPGGIASVSVQTTPGASCSIEYLTPAGPASSDQGLVAKQADISGAASWSWRIGSRSSLGIGTVTVTCDGVQATTTISIG